MDNIRNIIFDLGGVILNLRYESTIEALSELCGYDITALYSQQKQNPLFDDFETGKIAPAQFREGLRALLNIEADDLALDAAWNKMLLDIPTARLDFLKEVGKQKRIFLLSNTNAIHKAAFDEALQAAHGFEAMDHFFEKAYYSHLLGDRKPNVSIFAQVIQNHQLIASETLFIDDSPQHIEGARQAGLQALHKPSDAELVDFFPKL